MKILVLYGRSFEKLRKTIDDHLFSFQRYVPDVEFHYCDILVGVPRFLSLVKWDAVILHYCLVSERFDEFMWKYLSQNLQRISTFNGYKVAIPQDEYAETSELWKLFRQIGVKTVFTCAMPIDYDKLYPLEETGLKHRITVLTGYVDEETVEKLKILSEEIKEKSIDIGYRARNVPFWLGRHGRIKNEISDAIVAAENTMGLKLDISTKSNDVFYGDDWLKFLLRCRASLGCLGGASLYDPYGKIRKKVDEFVKQYPESTFDEVEKNCFPGQDFSLNLFALSPRHFECAMAKNCQILVEGDYQGVFKPGEHYIELKKDYSNYAEVFQKVADKEFCNKIVENTYRDVVESGKYTYRAFANQIIDHIRQQIKPNPDKQFLRTRLVSFLSTIRNKFWFARKISHRFWMKWKVSIDPKIKKLFK